MDKLRRRDRQGVGDVQRRAKATRQISKRDGKVYVELEKKPFSKFEAVGRPGPSLIPLAKGYGPFEQQLIDLTPAAPSAASSRLVPSTCCASPIRLYCLRRQRDLHCCCSVQSPSSIDAGLADGTSRKPLLASTVLLPLAFQGLD